jgi:FkbM family methyltransferase
MTFFDIGAYHGLYTVIADSKLQGSGKITAFEPSRREQRRLKLHLRMNRVSSVALEPSAVGSRTGSAELFMVVSGFASMNSLRRPADQAIVKPLRVQLTTLDEHVKIGGIKRLDAMKIDTEGGEMDVFRGARRILKELRPAIICEVLDWVTAPWGYAARDIVSHLQGYDYTWFDIQPDGTLSPHAPRGQYPEVRNYLAMPMEKVNAVRQWIQ